MSRLIVDGMNVIGSRADGWWRDRRGAVRRLAADLARYAERQGEVVTVVFDGRIPDGLAQNEPPGLLVLGAQGGGRGAADDRIVRLVDGDRRPWSITVVTSDRKLRERVRRLGASVVGASSLLDELARE